MLLSVTVTPEPIIAPLTTAPFSTLAPSQITTGPTITVSWSIRTFFPSNIFPNNLALSAMVTPSKVVPANSFSETKPD